ncbi:hypothetical protein [Janthinobacterium sp.]|uniref:hypothetical protein n=1 Tax=Janthinobacterium sp. TaxID=1871054 RepID=UPI002583985E|nr:hypothetical protein [Janthinobacterium sp.]MCX7289593.1 hypothetical protein [Janthinobacterium sp.]
MIISNKIQEFLKSSPAKYRFLESISLNRLIKKGFASEYKIEIILLNIDNDVVEAISMQFINSVDVKIGDLNNIYAMQLEIDDISSDQLEGVRYRITEQENSSFSFSCEDFYVTRLDR